MKKIFILLISVIAVSCAQGKKEFSNKALETKLIQPTGEKVSLQDIISKHKGKTILIDVWASWCGDCIKGMPGVKSIQEKHPKAEYVFISLDSNENSWKRGIQRYKVQGDHYFAKNGFKGDFAKSIKLNWIPTYILIGPDGKVIDRAKSINDRKLIKELNNIYQHEK